MKVAIVHYHLQPGGVTRVIENTLQAWKSSSLPIEAVVLSGRKYPGSLLQDTEIVEGLDYATGSDAMDPMTLATRLEESARRALGSLPDLWHFHNHSLGKNPSLPAAVSILAEKGFFLLLHPHDFAEDGRPENYKALRPHYSRAYPTGNRIAYAALNQRDRGFLKEMLEESPSKVHLLANSIPPAKEQEFPENGISLPENLFLYPVRAVRRKNLGELALLSILHPEKHFANSLGPTNPNFRKNFDSWKAFAKRGNLNLSYALAETCKTSFPQMVRHSRGIVTTSVAEGFGLGFLEPWTFGKGLCGRNIQEITSDFAKLGIELGPLYERLDVSVDLLNDSSELRSAIENSMHRFYSAYEVALSSHAVEQAQNEIIRDDFVDFGRLDENFQRQILVNLLHSEEQRSNLRNAFPLRLPSSSEISKNKTVVEKKFSQLEYGHRLHAIYEELLHGREPEIRYADGQKLLESFICPTRHNLLRTS